MKKLHFLAALTALSALGAAGLTQLGLGQSLDVRAETTPSARATDSTATYIHVNQFTAYRDGSETPLESFPIKDRNARFWDDRRSFDAITPFVSTIEGSPADGEAWTGRFESPVFTAEAGKYISFTIGGNSANVAKIYKDGAEVVTIAPTFNGPELANNMILKYYQVPEGKGGQYQIKFFDTLTSNYGGTVFGAVQYNQTLEDLARTFSVYKNNLPWTDIRVDNDGWDESNIRSSRWIMNYIYVTEAEYYAPLNNYVLTDVDEGFEKGEASLNNWAWDSTYTNIDPITRPAKGSMNWGAAVSDLDYHTFVERMPFNKTGSRFFKGYYEANQGGYPGDDAKFRLLSAEFTLSGSGFVSIKMSGQSASVHVLQYSSHAPNSEVAEKDGRLVEKAFYDQMNFYDPANGVGNIQESGSNTCTMTRHILDLREYLGQKIVLGLADWGDCPWGAVNYDELVTNYESTPAYKVDETFQDYGGGIYATRYDRFQIGKHADDSALPKLVTSSDMRSAFDYLESYHNVMRPNSGGNSYCGSVTSDEVKAVLAAYDGLSEGAQAIVAASEDYCRVAGEGAYYLRRISKNTVGQTIDYAKSLNKAASVRFANAMGNGSNVPASIWIGTIVLMGAVALGSVLAFHFLRGKKD